MRLKIGQSVRKTGTLLCLSKNGNLRIWKNQEDRPVGKNISILLRGRIAREIRTGIWHMEGIVDAELTAISLSYLDEPKRSHKI